MASDNVEERNFLSHVERARREIQTRFTRAHNILQERESDLLAELQRLADEYVGEGIARQLKELSLSKDALRDALRGNENKLIFDLSVIPIDARIEELKTKLRTAKYTYRSVSLEWDVELDKRLSVAGEIRLNAVREGIRDYRALGDPVVVFGKHSSKKISSPDALCYPNAIVINPENNCIYICEVGNNRVNSFIDNIYEARDVKLTSDQILVLSYRDPCVSLYSYSHQLIREIIARGEGTPVVSPAFFILDNKSNILITDKKTHCVSVFSFKGELVNKFGNKGEKRGEFIEPKGIAIDAGGRIIVVSQNPEHCVQVFEF